MSDDQDVAAFLAEMQKNSPFDPSIRIYLMAHGRGPIGVSSSSVMKGKSEEAIFTYLLPAFLRGLAKTWPFHSEKLEQAAAVFGPDVLADAVEVNPAELDSQGPR